MALALALSIICLLELYVISVTYAVSGAVHATGSTAKVVLDVVVSVCATFSGPK